MMRFHTILVVLVIVTVLVICTEAVRKRNRGNRGRKGRNNGHGSGKSDVLDTIRKRIEEHRKTPNMNTVPLPDDAVLIEYDILVSQKERVKQVQAIIDDLEDKRKEKEAKNGKKIPHLAVSSKKLKQRRKTRRNKRSMTNNNGVYEWPKGSDGLVTIQYDDSIYDSNQRKVIQSSISQYNDYTCIRFVPRFNFDHYIKLINGTGCWSWLGKIPSKDGFQEISLEARPKATCVNVGTVLHEFGHALGHHHEQNRPDRDDYITMKPEFTTYSEFAKQPSSNVELHSTPYDFRSIMHYSGVDYYFTMKQQINLADIVGRTNVLSFYDIQAINSRYECSTGCPAASCPAAGFQGADCNCYCFSGDTFKPIVNCGEVCVSVNQECNCAARTDACSGLPNTACNTGNGKCECVSGTFEVNGVCSMPDDIPCNLLNSNCLCRYKSSSTCSSWIHNSVCDPATNECICSGRFLELTSGSCTDANTLPCTLGDNCYCNLQTDSPCSSIANAVCNSATGACNCNSGYIQLEGQTTCTNLNSLSCNVLEQGCGCGSLGSNACQGLTNSECDADSGACFCSEDYYNVAGRCTPAPSCTSLDTNCVCSVQGLDACTAIPNSKCDYYTDRCICLGGYEAKSSTFCDLIPTYILNGQSTEPFTDAGTKGWLPAHASDSGSPITSDKTGEGWYLLADGLADSDTSSSFTLLSPELEGSWCVQYYVKHSHAEMSFSVLYFGTSYTYAKNLSPSNPLGFWGYGGISIYGAKCQFQLKVSRYNSGDFWAIADRIILYQC